MKKLLLSLVCVFSLVGAVNAQNKCQKDENFVQVGKGTWSLGVSAMLLNRNDVPFQTGLYAKYFVTDNLALRGTMRFGRNWATGVNPEFIGGIGEDNDGDYIYDSDDYQDNGEMTTIRSSNFMLVLGLEHRHKLSNRFFGYYGADLGAGGYGQIYRVKTDGKLDELIKTNRSADVTIQPFIGFEFFLGPRISLAAEFGYDVLFKFYQDNKEVYTQNSQNPYFEDIATVEKKYPQYNKIASHVDFGNCTFGALRLAFFF